MTKVGLGSTKSTLKIPASGTNLYGCLSVPQKTKGLVIFVDGGGSTRLSKRNHYLENELNEIGISTLLLDLLTEDEDREDMNTGHFRFDVGRLGDRLVDVIDWLITNESTSGFKLGLMGMNTGSAAAIIAAVRREKWINSLVSRGGRVDLAGSTVSELHCPTLLIVGSDDTTVLKLNLKVLNVLTCSKELAVIEGATHLFEEPGAMKEVARLTEHWFIQNLN